jgi:hypothetical protein
VAWIGQRINNTLRSQHERNQSEVRDAYEITDQQASLLEGLV